MADTTTTPPAPRFNYEQPVVWAVSGPGGSEGLDQAVKFAVTIGLGVELSEPGTYRLAGPYPLVTKLTEWIDFYKPAGPLVVAPERAPQKARLLFRVAPPCPPVRTAEIHSAIEADRMVGRAIDAGLTVRCVGLNRFVVTGPTVRHVAWVMGLFALDRPKALKLMNLTNAQAVAEDTAAPSVAVNVDLPTRSITSEIARDRDGNITNVKQLERTVP